MSTADLVALRGAGAAALVERDVVRIAGPDAVDYLQGQLSQDVAALTPGGSAWTFVLEPQGRVDVWARVTVVDELTVLMDTEPGWGDALAERLRRFLLRTDAEIDTLDWNMVAVRGADVPRPDAPPGGVVVAVARWRDAPGGWDLLGPGVVAPGGLVQVPPDALEVVRVEAGIPRMGAEIDTTTIPAESGVVAESVSFTKGCYTGQELVARMDSRGGRPARRVVRLSLSAPAEAGARLFHEDDEVGVLTSVAESDEGLVALGLLARSTPTPCDVQLGSPDGSAASARDI